MVRVELRSVRCMKLGCYFITLIVLLWPIFFGISHMSAEHFATCTTIHPFAFSCSITHGVVIVNLVHDKHELPG